MSLFNEQMFRLAWNQCRRHNYNNYTNFGLINEIYFYDKYIESIICDIITRINNKKYFFSSKYIVYIPKANGLARRISITTLEDQLVMQVILNYIAKKLDKNFIKTSYGNRYQYKKGKLGTNIFKPYYKQFNKFINAIIYNIEQGYSWICETDITAFHDTIAHKEIKNALNQYLNETDIQTGYIKELVADFLITDVIENNSCKKIIRGVPQGVEISNFFGNLILDEIDKKMLKLKNIIYLRYVDDIRILGKNEESVREALIYLQKILLYKELYINNAKTAIYNVDLNTINQNKLKKLQQEKLSIDKMTEIQLEEIQEESEKDFVEVKRMTERRNYLIKNYLIKKSHKQEKYFYHIEDILDNNPKHYYLVREIRNYRNKLDKEKLAEVYNKFLKNPYEVIRAPLIADILNYSKEMDISVNTKDIKDIQVINILMQEITKQDVIRKLIRQVLVMDEYAVNIGMKAIISLMKELNCPDEWKCKVIEKLISHNIYFRDTNLFIYMLFGDIIRNKQLLKRIEQDYKYTYKKYSSNTPQNLSQTLFDKIHSDIIDFSTIKSIIKQIRINLPIEYQNNTSLINPYNISVRITLDDEILISFADQNAVCIENKTPEEFLLMDIGNNYRITYMLGLIWFCLLTKEPMKRYNEIVPFIQFSPMKYKNKDIFKEIYSKSGEKFEHTLRLISSLTKKSIAHRVSIDKVLNTIEEETFKSDVGEINVVNHPLNRDLINFNKKRSTQMKIFISHSTQDKDYTDALVDLLHNIGIPKSEDMIFCSSKESYGVPIGENIYDYLKKQFDEQIMVIFILSKNYYKSPACLNEMGATWISAKEHYSILLPWFEYEEIKGAINPMNIGLKIDDKDKLTEFKDKITKELGLKPIMGQRWENDRKKFLDKIKSLKERDEEEYKNFKIKLEGVQKISSDEIELYIRFINEGKDTISVVEVKLKLEDKDRNTCLLELPDDELSCRKFYSSENRIELFKIKLPENTRYNANKHDKCELEYISRELKFIIT